ISYNGNLGRFETVLTREAYETWRRAQPSQAATARSRLGVIGYGATSTYEEMLANVPENVRFRLGSLNESLEHLVKTDEFDPALPRSVTERERRRLYATGATPDSMRSTGEAPKTQQGEW